MVEVVDKEAKHLVGELLVFLDGFAQLYDRVGRRFLDLVAEECRFRAERVHEGRETAA